MNIIKQAPLPICGLILATLSLGNLLGDIYPYLRYLFGLIGVVLLIIMLLKVIKYPQDIKNDFENPVILSSCGTFSMALMLLSTYLIEFTSTIAYAIWIIGICLHILLMIYFTYRFVIGNFDLNNVYPTWWIVYVGITMGAITSQIHGLKELGFVFFIIGFISMLTTTPLIFYRYIKIKKTPEANKPLICITTALMSILIVGYSNSTPAVSIEFLKIIYTIACLFYIFALYKFIDYRNLDFYPSFSAFTFPFVISALASKSVSAALKSGVINSITSIETLIATLIVVYVLIRYVNFFENSKKSRL